MVLRPFTIDIEVKRRFWYTLWLFGHVLLVFFYTLISFLGPYLPAFFDGKEGPSRLPISDRLQQVEMSLVMGIATALFMAACSYLSTVSLRPLLRESSPDARRAAWISLAVISLSTLVGCALFWAGIDVMQRG
jgi:hypothetical protein